MSRKTQVKIFSVLKNLNKNLPVGEGHKSDISREVLRKHVFLVTVVSTKENLLINNGDTYSRFK